MCTKMNEHKNEEKLLPSLSRVLLEFLLWKYFFPLDCLDNMIKNILQWDLLITYYLLTATNDKKIGSKKARYLENTLCIYV